MSHFDLPCPRYAVAKAQNSNFSDDSRVVWLGDGPKKICISSTLAKVVGSKSKVSKNGAKVPNLNADLGVGSCFGPLCRQKKVGIPNFFFPQNRYFAGLMMGPKKFQWLKFRQKVPLCRGFLSSGHPVGDIFEIINRICTMIYESIRYIH